MKKYLYSLLFMAMAIVSAVSFASCGGDDDDDPVKEDYFVYVCWVSDDILELADAVPNGVNISINTPATYGGISGKEGTVELTGTQAKDPKFSISFKLKSNWKEILATKESVVVAYNQGKGKTKGASINLDTNVSKNSVDKKRVGDEFESRVSNLISLIDLESK